MVGIRLSPINMSCACAQRPERHQHAPAIGRGRDLEREERCNVLASHTQLYPLTGCNAVCACCILRIFLWCSGHGLPHS